MERRSNANGMFILAVSEKALVYWREEGCQMEELYPIIYV
jgi:hypothetical protein